MDTQEKEIVNLMREMKNNSPHEYYRMIGIMEGLKINQVKPERKHNNDIRN